MWIRVPASTAFAEGVLLPRNCTERRRSVARRPLKAAGDHPEVMRCSSALSSRPIAEIAGGRCRVASY